MMAKIVERKDTAPPVQEEQQHEEAPQQNQLFDTESVIFNRRPWQNQLF